MKIAMICYSLTGESTGLRLKEGLEKLGHSVQLWKKSKYLPDSIKESCSPVSYTHLTLPTKA